MGIRAIIDHLITSEAGGQENGFCKKLTHLVEQRKITSTQKEVFNAAFDAGSAAAHRGHKPAENDLFTLLNIMENILYDFRVKPAQEREREKAAEELKAGTPQRKSPARKKPSASPQ